MRMRAKDHNSTTLVGPKLTPLPSLSEPKTTEHNTTRPVAYTDTHTTPIAFKAYDHKSTTLVSPSLTHTQRPSFSKRKTTRAQH